ncbi:MAG: CHAP domain-containing protein [Firmicutes bacterium]|nr:CHAP domain-containing protein [Bacillota bacterium]
MKRKRQQQVILPLNGWGQDSKTFAPQNSNSMNANVNNYKEAIDNPEIYDIMNASEFHHKYPYANSGKSEIYDMINPTNKANRTTPHDDDLTDYDINSISHPYLRDIYSRLKEKYYNEDYAENRYKTKDYLNGFSKKIKEINSLPYQCQKDRLTKDTIDWYHADGYVYWDKDYTYAPREQDMQKAKADADDLREAIKQQNEYLNSLPEWAVPIAKKFSVEYDEGYKQLQQNSDDYKALDKMESAKIWGAQFKEKIKEIEKMTGENETHGNQLAWLTNMYYNSDESEKGKYAKWADELREEHEEELSSKSGDPDIDKFLEIALKEVGTNEIGNNSTKYGDWYYNRKVSGEDYPWCATFVSWCANEAGLLGNKIKGYEGCTAGINKYGDRFHLKNNYTPKAGDVVFYGTNGGTHTGIVLAYDNGYIYAVEGNYGNRVEIVKRPVSSSYVYGFGSNGGTKSGKVPERYTTDYKGIGRTQ